MTTDLFPGTKPSEQRAISARRKAGLACSKKLEAAADSLNAYLWACRECRDDSANEKTGIADSRVRLIGDLMEYSGFLERRYIDGGK